MTPSPNASNPELVAVAVVVGQHGLHGGLKLKPNSPNPLWIDMPLQTLWLQDVQPEAAAPNAQNEQQVQKQAFDVEKLELMGPNRIRAHLKTVRTRQQAEQWLHAQVLIRQSDFDASGEIDVTQLEGLEARITLPNGNQQPIGTVLGLSYAGALQFLELKVTQTGKTCLIPFNPHVVPTVNTAQGYLVLAHLEGFFD
ncbi:MAG: hypothetical protein VKJ06_08885 [Vampirovibrionales bacterium]|nr:hypothetical protein [Vampirovibrionales bacterium]